MEVDMLLLAVCVYSLTIAICWASDPISSRMGPIDFGIPTGSFRELLKNNEGKKPRLTELYYENCGSSNDKGKLLDLKMSPTNTGDAIVTASGSTEVDLISPITVDIALQKHVLDVWVPVPCFRNFGSCHYEDFCRLGSRVCPVPFITDNGLPCRCPVSKGTYSVNMAFFQVPRLKTTKILTGKYKAKVEIFFHGERFACYNGSFAVDVSPFS